MSNDAINRLDKIYEMLTDHGLDAYKVLGTGVFDGILKDCVEGECQMIDVLTAVRAVNKENFHCLMDNRLN